MDRGLYEIYIGLKRDYRDHKTDLSIVSVIYFRQLFFDIIWDVLKLGELPPKQQGYSDFHRILRSGDFDHLMRGRK
jgi:hypothetical protein